VEAVIGITFEPNMEMTTLESSESEPVANQNSAQWSGDWGGYVSITINRLT
jgi:hypothetical protein